MADSQKITETLLEKATVYLLPTHQIILDELRLNLRRQGVKATKSRLIRAAITLLNEQKLDKIIHNLTLDQGE
jgi:hypothetical protein